MYPSAIPRPLLFEPLNDALAGERETFCSPFRTADRPLCLGVCGRPCMLELVHALGIEALVATTELSILVIADSNAQMAFLEESLVQLCPALLSRRGCMCKVVAAMLVALLVARQEEVPQQ